MVELAVAKEVAMKAMEKTFQNSEVIKAMEKVVVVDDFPEQGDILDILEDEVEINEKEEALRKDYIEDLKDNSELPDTIEDNGDAYEEVTQEETREKREEFEKKREELIKDWEEKHGKEWPRYKEDVYDEKTGNLIRKAGGRYDAHHIHPLSIGGKNEVDNITPISAEKHYDKRGVHAPDNPYAKLVKHCEERAK